jgi:hypothetical protein
MFDSSKLKRRTITMTYNKPEIVKMGEAVDAIQGQTFKSILVADSNPSTTHTAPAAYEADE